MPLNAALSAETDEVGAAVPTGAAYSSPVMPTRTAAGFNAMFLPPCVGLGVHPARGAEARQGESADQVIRPVRDCYGHPGLRCAGRFVVGLTWTRGLLDAVHGHAGEVAARHGKLRDEQPGGE